MYAGENARTLQAEDSYVKPTAHFAFENQGSAIPMQFTRDLPHLRGEMGRRQFAAQQSYSRAFE